MNAQGLHSLAGLGTRLHFTLVADGNPEASAVDIVERHVHDLKVVLGEEAIPAELLAKAELLVVIDILPTKATEAAHYVLPGTTFAEKRGTFINAKRRIQRLNPAIPPVGHSRPEWRTLAALLGELGLASYQTIEDVFADMARTIPALAGLNLSKVSDAGIDLSHRFTQMNTDSSVNICVPSVAQKP